MQVSNETACILFAADKGVIMAYLSFANPPDGLVMSMQGDGLLNDYLGITDSGKDALAEWEEYDRGE